MTFATTAAVVGAAASVKSLMSKPGGGGGSSSADKQPWAEVAPWLKNNVTKGEQLQEAYEAQPFNALQQTAYQNAFGDIDNYRNDLMPSMMQFAGGLLGPGFKLPQSYSAPGQQRGAPAGFMTTDQGRGQQAYSPEQYAEAGQFIKGNIDNPAMIQQEAARRGLSNADMLRAAQTVDPNIGLAQVDQFMGRRDPQYARPTFGLIDWNTTGPRTAAPAAPAAAVPGAETEEQRRLREQEEMFARYNENTSAGM